MLVVETAVGHAALSRARALGLPLDDLADRLGVSPTVVDDLLRGRTTVSEGLAHQLSNVLGETPGYWRELDRDDDEADLVAAWVAALGDFKAETLQALRSRGRVTATRAQPERLAAELAAFFGCRPDEVDALVDVSFRQSSAHTVHADAVSTWLRLAEQQAAWLADLQGTPVLDREGLRALLPRLVRVGGQAPADYVPAVRDELAEVGVVLVFQGDVKGSRLSGASWTTPAGHAVVALSLRYRLDDYFWWTVFHECAHLLLGHARSVDSLDAHPGEKETAADGLAKQLLLPDSWHLGMTKPSKQRVAGVGRELGVPAGVLVGQLQHAGRVALKDMNGLKQRMPKPEDLEVHTRVRPSGPEWSRSMARLVEQATQAS
jgi:HTH-type transcriptional regulator/antitoxin HigA